jgi:hypothetical protein
MFPLYQDSWFTFRFAEDRIVPRFRLEGVAKGCRVSIIKIDPATCKRQGLLTTATVGDDGWVDVPEPIIVRAAEGFIAVPITHRLDLTVIPDTVAVCRLDKDAPVPAWASSGEFFSITHTADELSVVCSQTHVPSGVSANKAGDAFALRARWISR